MSAEVGDLGGPDAGAAEALTTRELPGAWRMCFWSTIGVAVCSSPVALVTVGLFMKPLGAAYGWSRASVALAISIGAIALALSTPLAGRLIDRFGVRRILLASLVSYGVAVASVPWCVRAFGLPGLYGIYVVIGVLSAGSNTIAYARVLTGWFKRSRGLALGIGMSGIPIGMAITPPLAQCLIEQSGWESAFVGLAALPVLVGVPVAALALHEAPIERGAQTVAFGLPPGGTTRKQAMRARGFWTLLIVFLLLACAMNGIELHIVPLLTDRGFPPMVAALSLSLLNIVAIGARVGAGFLFDRSFAPRVAAWLFGLPLIATVLLLGSLQHSAAYAAAVMLGFGIGAESDLLGYLIGRYFGLRAYGEMFGWIFGAFMLGTAAGPYLFGLGYDAHGNYILPLSCAAAALAAVCALLWSMPRYPRGI